MNSAEKIKNIEEVFKSLDMSEQNELLKTLVYKTQINRSNLLVEYTESANNIKKAVSDLDRIISDRGVHFTKTHNGEKVH